MTTEADKIGIVEAWKKCRNATQVGIEFGITARRVNEFVKEAVFERLEKVGKAAEVAREFGLSRMTTSRYARAREVPLKQTPGAITRVRGA